MGTHDQIMNDSRYTTNIDENNSQFTKQQQQNQSFKDDDANGSQGRRVFLESPSFDNKEEEDMYRYVPSRLTDRTTSIIDTTHTKPTAGTMMDTLDFELDMFATNHARSNLPRSDPRRDPLLGPLLAELDTMSNQQLPSTTAPYSSNLVHATGSSTLNHGLTNFANRTVNDALFESDLYNTFEPRTQLNMNTSDIFAPSSTFLNHFGPEDQLFQRPLLHTLGQNYLPNPRLPLSLARDTPTYVPPRQQVNDQSIASPRPPPQPGNPFIDYQRSQPQPTNSFPDHHRSQPPSQPANPFIDYQRSQPPPPQQPPQPANPFIDYQRSQPSSQPANPYVDRQRPQPPSQPTNPFIDRQRQQPLPSQPTNPFIDYQRQQPRQEERQVNQEAFFTDHVDDQQGSSQRTGDQDSKRQAVWNEFQRTSAKAREKNAKKQHESPTRNRAPFGSTLNSNGSGNRQSPPQRSPIHQQPPIPKPNHVDESIDTMKNKENSYQRSPARKFENTYATRKDFEQEFKGQMQAPIRQASLPITVNLNTGEHLPSGSLPTTMAIPVDSQVNRVGDKISLNIDLRLVDVDNLQQQQQHTVSHPQWSNGDPLDLHIRKFERNMEQTLPVTSPPQRQPVMPSTAANPMAGRYANKQASGGGRAGYSPPTHGVEYYNPQDKNRDEDSYLAKLNQNKRSTQFKPYTGRDYEQFKKNYGFGIGHLGNDYDSTTHKEKLEQTSKARQYAQQIEARNKKKLSEPSRRTLSDTRLPKSTRVNDAYDM